MKPVRTATCAIAILVTLGDHAPAAARTVTLTTPADPCQEVCLFPLCLTGTGAPRVSLCAEPARADIVVRSPVSLNPLRPTPVHLRVFGARIRLVCFPVARPCRAICADQADCAFNGPFSRCVDGTCRLLAGCSP
jgi:hypothetical protein